MGLRIVATDERGGSTVFLGLTVGCARCHDHKFDPFHQLHYYRLQGLHHPKPTSFAELLRRVCLDLTGLPPTPAEVPGDEWRHVACGHLRLQARCW